MHRRCQRSQNWQSRFMVVMKGEMAIRREDAMKPLRFYRFIGRELFNPQHSQVITRANQQENQLALVLRVQQEPIGADVAFPRPR